jgi:hypothetical protein
LGRIAKAINALGERMDMLADRPGIDHPRGDRAADRGGGRRD